MTTFRKLPVLIEAHQWFKNGDHPEDGDPATEGQVVRYFRHPDYDGAGAHEPCGYTWHDHGWIDTLEGGHTVCPGDWIITGVADERYPCKPAIFAATYETAEPDEINRLLACDELPAHLGADARTMRGVFADLAYRVWTEGEDFSGKRPFGNSGWWSDFLESIVAAGIAEDDESADDLARRAIRRMGGDEA